MIQKLEFLSRPTDELLRGGPRVKRWRLGLLVLSLFAVACSQSVTIDPGSMPSLLKFTVLSKDSVIADGFTDLTVTVKVEDGFNKFKANYVPVIAPATSISNSALGVNHYVCSATNSEGIATCKFRSLYEGNKRFDFVGAGNQGDQDVDIVFVASPEKKGQLFDIVSSAQMIENTGNGDWISSTVGKTYDSPRQRMNGNEWLFRADISVKY